MNKQYIKIANAEDDVMKNMISLHIGDPNKAAINPLPTALALSVLGGLGGYGASYLTKHQKKHKLRNTLMGATALPALYMLFGRGNELAKKFNTKVLNTIGKSGLSPGFDLEAGEGEALLNARDNVTEAYRQHNQSRDMERWPKNKDWRSHQEYTKEILDDAKKHYADLLESKTIKRENIGKLYDKIGIGLGSAAGALGFVGLGSHWFDTMQDKYGPVPEGIDEFEYYTFMENQEKERKEKERAAQREEGIKSILANTPKDVIPDAYRDFINAKYKV